MLQNINSENSVHQYALNQKTNYTVQYYLLYYLSNHKSLNYFQLVLLHTCSE